MLPTRICIGLLVLLTTASSLIHAMKWHGSHSPRNIYIDLGTNDGESILAFVEGLSVGDTATDGSASLQGGWGALMNCKGGNMNSSSWDVIAFEANDMYTPHLQTISSQLLKENKVRSFQLYGGTAISTFDGKTEFIYDGPFASSGSTTMSESRSAIGNKVTVPTMDITTLFHQKQQIRTIDFVVLKVDIEGAEYDLVRRIITSGLWRFIDRLAVEWHHTAHFVFGHPGEDPAQPNYQQRLAIHEKYLKRYESLMWMMEDLRGGPKLFEWGR